MIIYKKCSDSTMDEIYSAFKTGFSDYIIKIDISLEMFEKRFFGSEGNQRENSYIAFNNGTPVGLILGGLKIYEGVKTLRCGTLCIHPEFRGKGISQKLFELHKQTAVESGCKQLFLEVIVGNDRAIAFYKKLGYEKVYDLGYYSNCEPLKLQKESVYKPEIKEIDTETLKGIQSEIQDIHINWQNDFDCLEKVQGQINYGVYDKSKLVAVMSCGKLGNINFIWVSPRFRFKGVGRALISFYAINIKPNKLSISFPNNAKLKGFLKHLDFNEDAVKQYEMYLTL